MFTPEMRTLHPVPKVSTIEGLHCRYKARSKLIRDQDGGGGGLVLHMYMKALTYDKLSVGINLL